MIIKTKRADGTTLVEEYSEKDVFNDATNGYIRVADQLISSRIEPPNTNIESLEKRVGGLEKALLRIEGKLNEFLNS